MAIHQAERPVITAGFFNGMENAASEPGIGQGVPGDVLQRIG